MRTFPESTQIFCSGPKPQKLLLRGPRGTRSRLASNLPGCAHECGSAGAQIGTNRRHARRVLAGAREAPAGGCSSSGRGSDGKCTLLINRSVVTSPSSLRTSTSAQIAQTAERQLCSRRRLTGDADAAARTAPVGRDGMCTPASRLGPQGGSGRGEQAKVTFGPVLTYPGYSD